MIDFKIVIVEADMQMRDSMQEILMKSFMVTTFTSGKACLDALEKQTCDLVLIDFQIEDISSIQLQQEINKLYPAIHVAMISNIDRTKVSIESMRRRAMDYVYRSDNQERFMEDVCKLVRYIVDTRKQDTNFIKSGFYKFAKKLYDEKKWTIEELEKKVEEK